MDPLTISALIALAPTVAGMPWGEIFNGTKFTTDGWHGWTSAEKNAFMVDGIEKGFKFSKQRGSKLFAPRLFLANGTTFYFSRSRKNMARFL